MTGDFVEYKDFQITVLVEGKGYVAWAERRDRGLIDAGYGSSRKVGTVSFDTPGAAVAQAKSFIDKGQWVQHGHKT